MLGERTGTEVGLDRQVDDQDRPGMGHLRHDVGVGAEKLAHGAGEKRIDDGGEGRHDVAGRALVGVGESPAPVAHDLFTVRHGKRMDRLAVELVQGAEAEGILLPFEVGELCLALRRCVRHLHDITQPHAAIGGVQGVDRVLEEHMDRLRPEVVLRRRFRPTLVGVCGLRQPHEELYQVHRLECAGRLAPCQLVLEEVELTPTAAVKDDHRFAAPGLGAVALPQLSLTRLGAQHQPAEPGAQHSVRDGVS